MVGALRSTLLPVTGPAVAQLPALSQTCRVPVAALAVSLPAATDVLNEKLASLALARPDVASVAVHAIDTLPACHSESALPQATVGATVSTVSVRLAGDGSVFCAASVARTWNVCEPSDNAAVV